MVARAKARYACRRHAGRESPGQGVGPGTAAGALDEGTATGARPGSGGSRRGGLGEVRARGQGPSRRRRARGRWGSAGPGRPLWEGGARRAEAGCGGGGRARWGRAGRGEGRGSPGLSAHGGGRGSPGRRGAAAGGREPVGRGAAWGVRARRPRGGTGRASRGRAGRGRRGARARGARERRKKKGEGGSERREGEGKNSPSGIQIPVISTPNPREPRGERGGRVRGRLLRGRNQMSQTDLGKGGRAWGRGGAPGARGPD
jgi:hypothetical protein